MIERTLQAMCLWVVQELFHNHPRSYPLSYYLAQKRNLLLLSLVLVKLLGLRESLNNCNANKNESLQFYVITTQP